jgi:glutaconate CoA-transferase subunit A
VIGLDPSRTIVPDFKVVAVVEEPYGSHPGYTPGFYDVDFAFGSLYQKASDTEQGFKEFLDEWVYGTKDRADYIDHYIKKFGWETFRRLQAGFGFSYPVSYEY